MRKTTKNKLIISIVSAVLVVGLGVGLYFLWPAITGTINNTGYITAEKGQELYDQGVEDGNKNKKEQEEKILYYQNLVDQYNVTLSENKARIEDLQAQNQKLSSLSSEKEAIIASNNETIKELRAQIGKLENSIEEYKALVESLKASYEVTATFIFDGQVHKVAVVKRGECVGAIEDPISSSSAEFEGWQVDGVTVDPATYVLEDDTIFLAATNQRYRVDYFANGEIFTTQYVTSDEYPTIVDTPSLFGHTFKGWSLDGANIIETRTYPITANTVFYAVFEEIKCTITFMVDDTTYNTQVVGYGDGITTPTNPTKTNYTFKGWSIDGTTVATISPAYLEDTTYVALFEKATICIYQTDNEKFSDFAPFTITWYDNNPSFPAGFYAVLDDVYVTGQISNGEVSLHCAENLSTKQCYTTISEINLSHTTYEFTDNNGYKVTARYATTFTDALKALILADYNENNCQYFSDASAMVAWSYYITDLLTDVKIEIDGEYQSWPNTIRINFDCVGYARTSKSALVAFESVYGYTPRFGYGSTNNLKGSTTI